MNFQWSGKHFERSNIWPLLGIPRGFWKSGQIQSRPANSGKKDLKVSEKLEKMSGTKFKNQENKLNFSKTSQPWDRPTRFFIFLRTSSLFLDFQIYPLFFLSCFRTFKHFPDLIFRKARGVSPPLQLVTWSYKLKVTTGGPLESPFVKWNYHGQT